MNFYLSNRKILILAAYRPASQPIFQYASVLSSQKHIFYGMGSGVILQMQCLLITFKKKLEACKFVTFMSCFRSEKKAPKKAQRRANLGPIWGLCRLYISTKGQVLPKLRYFRDQVIESRRVKVLIMSNCCPILMADRMLKKRPIYGLVRPVMES